MTSRQPQPDNSAEGSSDPPASSSKKPRRHSKGDGLNIGLTIGATITIFVIGGNWLDQKLGSEPWLTLLGATFALASIVLYLLKYAKS